MNILKEIRSKNGYTQQYVADYLEMTRAAYTNIENGKRQPDNNIIIKLSELYNVTTDYLLGREETKKGPAEAEPKEQPDEDDIRYALSGEVKDLTDEEFQEIMNYVKYIEQKRRKK